MPETRSETDSFGPIDVPSDKYWGAQTQRSIKNFPIGWEKQPIAIVRSLGIIKKACAQANIEMGNLDKRLGEAIINSATEVIEGKFDDNFPLVVWQTGSGTQSNMNANEVIANRAIEILGGTIGSKDPFLLHTLLPDSLDFLFTSTLRQRVFQLQNSFKIRMYFKGLFKGSKRQITMTKFFKQQSKTHNGHEILRV